MPVTEAAATPRRWSGSLPARWLLAALLVAVASAGALALMGHPLTCPCGTVKLWYGEANGSETAQHLSDPYTFVHLTHGLIIYGLLRLVARWRRRAFDPWLAFFVAVAVECGWEVLEATPFVIERYRTATSSQDYFGDSIVNSTTDVLACALGFVLAARLPALASTALVVLVEIALGLLIRDNLTITILLLVFKPEALRSWQSGS